MSGSAGPLFRRALVLVAGVTLLRIVVLLASPLQLYPDEAQYWSWAQTPDFGYFSKPPLIAWIIRATTFLFGDREWAVRISIPLFHAGTALLLYAIGRKVFPREPSVAFWSALAYLTLPGVSYSCGLASTDAPLLFFWALALLAFLKAVETGGWRWALLCGAAVGLGLLSKYAMALFAGGVVAGAAADLRIRRFVFGIRGLAALGVAGLIVAPNVLWNMQHAFATVWHVQTNADWARARVSPVRLAAFLAGQFGVFGPVLMAGWLAALGRAARQGESSTAASALFAFSIPSLALVAAQSFVADANANWAATAYVAAVPLAIAEIRRHWPVWTLGASFVLDGLLMLLLAGLLIRPQMAAAIGLDGVFKRETGWRELAASVEAEFARGPYTAVASDNRSVTAELLYYTRGRHLPIRIWDPDLGCHNHFEMTIRLVAPEPRVLLVLSPDDAPQVMHTFESVHVVAVLSTPIGGRHVRAMALYDAHVYRGPGSGG